MTVWNVFTAGLTVLLLIIQVHYKFVIKTLQDKDEDNARLIRDLGKKIATFMEDDRADHASISTLKERVRGLELEIEIRQNIAHNIKSDSER